MRKKRSRRHSLTAINAALTATKLDQSDYQMDCARNLYAQAVPLQVAGAYDSAKTAYDKARELNPTNPQIPYIIAQLNIAHRDNKAAQEDLKTAITVSSKTSPPPSSSFPSSWYRTAM